MTLKENIKEKRFISPKKSGKIAEKDHQRASDFGQLFFGTSLDTYLQNKNIKQNLAICGKENARSTLLVHWTLQLLKG